MNKLDKDTFKRFKLIENMIKEYPIIKFDLKKINNIKDNFKEYTPEYKIVNKNLKIQYSLFVAKEILNETKSFKQYVHIKTNLVDIKISYLEISDTLINMVYSIILLFQKLHGNKNKDRKIKVNIFLSNVKREITKEIIGILAVNGGATDGITIDIHRKEELLKVLCHELCHFFKLDCYKINNDQDKIHNKYKIEMLNDITLSLSEAINECEAMLYHVAIISYYTKKSPYLIYHYEKIWSLYQACHVLNHYNMKKFEDVYESKFKQETNVFSYYVIKFFLLWKMNNKCCIKNIDSILNDQEIIKTINKNINKKFDKGLRMTLFELKI